MKRKNANIKSKRELIERMLAGEVFWLDGKKIEFDESGSYSPFSIGSAALDASWGLFTEMEKECPWHEDIPGCGVWCWVKDAESHKSVLRLITEYKKGHKRAFVMNANAIWEYAEPASQEDVIKHFFGNNN